MTRAPPHPQASRFRSPAAREIEATVGRAAKAPLPGATGRRAAGRKPLERIAAAVENAADELVASADLETALGRARLHGEFARTTGQLRLFADVLRDGKLRRRR